MKEKTDVFSVYTFLNTNEYSTVLNLPLMKTRTFVFHSKERILKHLLNRCFDLNQIKYVSLASIK